jgi:hypothetical protein
MKINELLNKFNIFVLILLILNLIFINDSINSGNESLVTLFILSFFVLSLIYLSIMYVENKIKNL